MRFSRNSAALGVALVLCTHSMALAADWPQFRGPNRDGICSETQLSGQWPENGPPLLWKTDGIGTGFSSPVVADKALYVTGDIDDDLVILSFDLQGKLRWKATNGKAWKGPYPGARSTCTVHNGRLYNINAHGRVVCLDAHDGRTLWSVDMLERFGAENIHWGISECPLVDRGNLIVTPGGTEAFMAALDTADGTVKWTTPPLTFTREKAFGGKPVRPPKTDADRTGYASPIAFDIDGRRFIATCSARHYVIVNADERAIAWTCPVDVRFEVIGAIPVAHDRSILFTAPDVGGALYELGLTKDELTVEKKWQTDVDNCHGALLRWNDRFVGSGYRLFRGWACLDAKSGEILDTMPNMPKGSVIYADSRFYALGERGTLRLLELEDNSFRSHGSLSISDGKRADAWAHPTISDGRLYLRYHDTLSCYDVREKP
jgi:outer membrane protein assembly factor BamB